MSMISNQQLAERELLREAIATVTKVEPRQFADRIHHLLVNFIHEEGDDIKTTLERLGRCLGNIEIHTCTGGSNLGGWHQRWVTLSSKQQEVIHAWISFWLKTGGTVSPYEDA